MKFKKNEIKKLILAIIIPIVIFALFNKVKSLNRNSVIFPSDETITINLSEIPQVPWDTSRAVSHVIETFSASVHGCLILKDENSFEGNLKQNTLLENYYCEGNICHATLKSDILFHNGREVTAYDIEFSLIRSIIQKNKNIVVASIIDDIIGIEDLSNENILLKKINSYNYPTGLVKGIEVVDNYNIVFKLKRKNKFFFDKIAIGRIPIVPIEEFDSSYTNWKRYPIGFGKYKVDYVNWEKYEFVLKRFKKSENIPKYIRFIFSNKDEGDIKILLGDSGRGKSGTDRRIIFPSIYSNGGFLFNFKTKLGANKKFREAISLALDREKIAYTAYYKEITPEDQMIPLFSSMREYRADMPIQSQNVEKAKMLLDQVPHELWKNKIFHVHTYWANIKNINSLPYIQEIINQLKDVGIHTVFHDTDLSYPKFKIDDQNVMWWTGFGFSSNDPNKNFSFFKKDSYYMNEAPNDPLFDTLYNESVKNGTVSNIYTKRLCKYFTENNIFVIVLNQKMSFAYNSERISSLGEQHNGVLFYVWKMKLR
ncbi:hypothetical protein GCL60_13560 [Silvanigrella paludirubra]|uniref:Solute-binding protein family 5 domain-containing protein n=1 Tax=Silvanigrella paludirubra TaxID=2499159 RepID=A0A6N6VQA4_9BACT|nr:ABC transporter substrate-binding protein [Silvanigrella paludirubra]KAB8036867.1 hypothetical protein GCL60_13560 [Silvanigrella paludirubra]